MYKIEIELGWDEKVIIETDDFNKIALIQEFIELQDSCDWGNDDVYTDEDGITWYYDEESDEWCEIEEDEEDYE